jgi:hypothetical protein
MAVRHTYPTLARVKATPASKLASSISIRAVMSVPSW